MIYALSFELGLKVQLKQSKSFQAREDVVARLNDYVEDLKDSSGMLAFMGISEGLMLSEEAHSKGYETESWVLDSGMAPHERDWLSHEHALHMVAYFSEEAAALKAAHFLKTEYELLSQPTIEVQVEQDWNVTWKASFTGITVNEHLKVLPPWSEEWLLARDQGSLKGIMAINPGAGFGTGTHETTQLCLGVLQSLGDLSGKIVLDFGSGSGILGIAAALQGASCVYCVEIDPMANDNARDNAALNSVTEKIKFLDMIPNEIKGGKVDILLANILRPILLQFSPVLQDCLKAESELVLSGLIDSDLSPVIECYQKGKAPFAISKYEKNEWRALWLRKGNQA